MESCRLLVEGMSCGGCAQRINAVLRRVEGVSDAQADHASGRVEVRLNPAVVTRAVLVERIEAAGYRIAQDEVAG